MGAWALWQELPAQEGSSPPVLFESRQFCHSCVLLLGRVMILDKSKAKNLLKMFRPSYCFASRALLLCLINLKFKFIVSVKLNITPIKKCLD